MSFQTKDLKLSYGKIALSDRYISLKSHVNPAAAGPPRRPPAAGGGAYSCPLYFCNDIVCNDIDIVRDRETNLCTHLSEYLAEDVSKFGVDPIWNDVTVTSEVKL